MRGYSPLLPIISPGALGTSYAILTHVRVILHAHCAAVESLSLPKLLLFYFKIALI